MAFHPLFPTKREISYTAARRIADGLLNLLFPDSCVACGSPVARLQEAGVCESCWRRLVDLRIAGPHCPSCGLPLPGLDAGDRALCTRCSISPPTFSGARSFGYYRGELAAVLRALKFRGRKDISELLSALLADTLVAHWGRSAFDLIVPVPLHAARQRERGFNQSELLAGALSRLVALPCPQGVLRRVRRTRPQVGLAEAERRENVRAAFVCARQQPAAGARILLLDDVMTTGATADSAASALYGAGALRVSVLTVARAVPGGE